MQNPLFPFQQAWLSFDLGTYRPCNGTYCYYNYEELPPLDTKLFQGTFDWLPNLSQHLRQRLAVYQQIDENTLNENLQSLLLACRAKNIQLPPEFIVLMNEYELQQQIPSCTACYFDLSTDIIPSPLPNDDAYLIRFLNDQQDVLLWYLYLKPTGEHCVVVSPICFDDQEYTQTLPKETILANTFYCAASFEAFIYRFWLENTIWFDLESNELSEVSKQYVTHYQKINN